MKIVYFYFSIILMFCIMLFQLTACSSSLNPAASTPQTNWIEKSSGSIETNDVTRLQKEVPFTIILPDYLPDGLSSYKLVINKYELYQVINVQIYYYHLKIPKEISIREVPPTDQWPRPLPPGLLTKMHPDYTPLELRGIEVMEKSGYGEIIRSAQKIQVTSFLYGWEKNDLVFSAGILGYNQADSRKIVESMLK